MEEWALLLNNRIIKRFTIKEGDTLTIGRGQDADITVDNSAISRQHSSLELKGGVYYLTDLYSLNGTKVNGEKIDSAVPIKKTDQIEIGKFTLKPAAHLTTEAEVGSFSASMDGMDQTLFVNSRPKPTAPTPQDVLKVVAGSAKPASLTLTGKESVKVGRDASCDILITGLFVAGTQFFITSDGNSFAITPSPGLRKVYVNGNKIAEAVKLTKGDVIKVAGTTFRFD